MAEPTMKPLKEPSKAKKVTLRMMSEQKRTLPVRILADGYNMREKSKWVVEAIRSLLSHKDWEGALLSEIIVRPDDRDVITIPTGLVTDMDMEIRRVVSINPSLNANRSSVIRAAINRRLLGIYTEIKE